MRAALGLLGLAILVRELRRVNRMLELYATVLVRWNEITCPHGVLVSVDCQACVAEAEARGA